MGRNRGGNASAWGFGTWLAVITVAALALRLLYVIVFRIPELPFGGDALIYQRSANVLAQGYGFGSPFKPNLPFADHPPLYVVWLAIPALLNDGFLPQSWGLVWSCFLGAGTVLVIGFAGREILGERCGLIAAALATVYPNLWMWDGMLFSESMSLLTVALLILLAYRYWRAPSLPRVLWLGGACGLAALARAELLLVVPFVLLPLVLLTRRESWWRRVQWVVAGGLVALVVVTPWVAYNLQRFKEPVYLSSGDGQTLAAANCPVVYHGRFIGWKSYECQIRAALDVIHEKTPGDKHPNIAHPKGLDRSELDVGSREIAVKYIKKNLDQLPLVVLARWGRAFQVYHPSTDMWFNIRSLKQENWVAWAGLISFWVLGIVAIVGAFVLRRRRVPVFPLLAFPLIVLISVATTFGQLRYRASLEVSVVLLASVAIDALFGRGRDAPTEAPVVEEPKIPAAVDA